ncbi:MAG: RHS repeat-associated core domain-containing protein [Thermoleophilaceae bacterium]
MFETGASPDGAWGAIARSLRRLTVALAAAVFVSVLSAAGSIASGPPPGVPYTPGYNATADGLVWFYQADSGNWIALKERTGSATEYDSTGAVADHLTYSPNEARSRAEQLETYMATGEAVPIGGLPARNVAQTAKAVADEANGSTPAAEKLRLAIWRMVERTAEHNPLERVGDVDAYLEPGPGTRAYRFGSMIFHITLPPLPAAELTGMGYSFARAGTNTDWVGACAGVFPAPVRQASYSVCFPNGGSSTGRTEEEPVLTGSDVWIGCDWLFGKVTQSIGIPAGFTRMESSPPEAVTCTQYNDTVYNWTTTHASWTASLASLAGDLPHLAAPGESGTSLSTSMPDPTTLDDLTDRAMADPDNMDAVNTIIRDGGGPDLTGPGGSCGSACVPIDTRTTPIPPDAANGGGTALTPPFSHCGDPVVCATGDFYETYSDLRIPGRGRSIDAERSYNSSLAANADQGLGYGWTQTYGARATASADGTEITVRAANGSGVTFTANPDGSYSAGGWVKGSLAKVGTTLVLTYRDQTQDVFDGASGRLLKQRDRNGYETTLGYNPSGQLTAVTDASGRTLAYSYNPNGQISSISDPVGRSVGYVYDASGDLRTATNAGGFVTHYDYDAQHRLTTITDPRGGITHNIYDSQGRVTSQTDAEDHTMTWSYAAGRTTVTSPRGLKTVYTFRQLLPTKIVRAAGTSDEATETFDYDLAFNLTTRTDALGHTTRATYDDAANQLTATDPLGRTTTSTYNSLNEPLTVTDPAGVTTTYTYDGSGNPTRVSRPLTGTSTVSARSWHYDDAAHPGDATSMTDPLGHDWHYEHDAAGNLTAVVDPEGDRTTYAYDAIGRITYAVSARGNAAGANRADFTTYYDWDALGRPTRVADPLGHATTYGYNANGDRTSVRDPDGKQTQTDYDHVGRPTVVSRADNTAVTTTYDADGNVISVRDGLTHATTYAYDGLERRTAETDALGKTEAYGYDAAGRLRAKTDRAGRTTTYTHDDAGELTGVAYGGSVTPDVHYTYDGDGRRKTMADGTGTTSYTWDSLGRLTDTTNGRGDHTGFSYDLAGNQTSVTYPNGHTVTRGFDSAGRMTAVTDWLGNTTSFGYDHDSDLLSATFPTATGDADSYGYDRADRLASMTMARGQTTLAGLAYDRDANGQLTQATPTGLPGASESFGYDALNQLTSDNSSRYAYDAGDRTTKLAGVDAYGYDAANELKSSPTASFSYDELGDRTAWTPPAGTPATYSYDRAGRLLTAYRPLIGVAAGASATYVIRADAKVVASGDNSTGQLGDGTTTQRTTPVAVASVSGVTQVAGGGLRTGGGHALALTSDRDLWAWGANGSGQVTGTTGANVTTPVRVLTAVVQAAAGGSHSLAVRTGGDVYGWGSNADSQLGVVTPGSTGPTRVQGISDATQVAAGASHSLALTSGGSVYAWGSNSRGQIGTGLPPGTTVPAPVPVLSGAKAIAAGASASYAVKTDGTVWAWGANGGGQLGNGTTTDATSPVRVSGLSAITQVAAGYGFALALGADGRVWAWGENSNGQLGLGTTTAATTPQLVSVTATALAAGAAHALAFNGTSVSAWGLDASGQLGDGATADRRSPQAATAFADSALDGRYAYDGDGLRATKTVAGERAEFSWDLSAGLPELLSDGQRSYIYGPDDLVLEQIDGQGRPTYYHHDQLGSTRLLTDASGAAAASFSYDPYGQPSGQTGTQTTPFGFAGQYTDSETGYQYLRARYYDPQTAQFLSRDPLGLASGETNLYGYAGRDPVDATDPSGLVVHIGPVSVPTTPGEVVDAGGDVLGAGIRAGATAIAATPPAQAIGIASEISGATIGGCVTASVAGGGHNGASICYVESPDGSHAITFGASSGHGTPGWGLTAAPIVSNANKTKDLGGPFGFRSLSAGFPPYAASVMHERGTGACGQPVSVWGVGWQPYGEPLPIQGSGGTNHTWVFNGY